MMKKLLIAFALLFAASSANAIVIGSFIKAPTPTTITNTLSIVFIKPIVTTPPAIIVPPPVVAPVAAKTETPAPVQFFALLTEETTQIINDIVNCVDEPNGGGHDNVSAVPVPAALPLMATALGIFGITRRRKTFK